MSLSRYTQKLFGSTAGSNTYTAFGGLAAGYPSVPTQYTGSTITPAIVQSLANFLTGWTGAAVAGNSPSIQDMNALFYNAFYQLCYLFQQGVPEWDSATVYVTGSLVQNGGVVYRALQASTNEAVTNATYWGALDGNVQTKSANYQILSSDKLVLMSGTHNATLPDPTKNLGRAFEIKNVDGSGNTVTVLPFASETIDGASSYPMAQEYQFVNVRSDGTNWNVVAAG